MQSPRISYSTPVRHLGNFVLDKQCPLARPPRVHVAIYHRSCLGRLSSRWGPGSTTLILFLLSAHEDVKWHHGVSASIHRAILEPAAALTCRLSPGDVVLTGTDIATTLLAFALKAWVFS